MNKMRTLLHKVAHDNKYVITEKLGLPDRQARMVPIPPELNQQVQERLSALYPKGLYHHQSLAISYGLQGGSSCVATPTASGKTVIFSSIATSVELGTGTLTDGYGCR